MTQQPPHPQHYSVQHAAITHEETPYMFPSTSFVDSTSTYTNGHTNPSLARRDGNPPGQSRHQSQQHQQQQQQQQQQRQQSQLFAQQQLQHQQLLQQQQAQAGMVNMFPTAAGHQLDLNHLWQQVQELSAILAANRESTAGLVRRADEIRNRTDLGESGHLLREAANGEPNGVQDVDFEAENLALRNENIDLRAENEDLSLLVQDYETVLEKVLEGLRVYAREHAASTINIHQTYTNQLQSERQQNAMLRQNETESQTRLTTISKLLREAYQSETALEPDTLIEGLKVENEVLREALGLPKDCEGGGGDSEHLVLPFAMRGGDAEL